MISQGKEERYDKIATLIVKRIKLCDYCFARDIFPSFVTPCVMLKSILYLALYRNAIKIDIIFGGNAVRVYTEIKDNPKLVKMIEIGVFMWTLVYFV